MQTENTSLSQNLNNKSVKAKKRWQILSEALRGSKSRDTCQNLVSVRRFQCYGLFNVEPAITHEEEATWMEYTCSEFPLFQLSVRHLTDKVNPETLHGFNNTGNVCIWPSEEVMTYFCLKNCSWFDGKAVCELGGGMTCLAGMSLAVYSSPSCVELTDGNENSIKNLDIMVKKNHQMFGSTQVNTRVLKWGPSGVDADLQDKFDYILCADCLFFEEGRQDLVDTLYSLLKTDGEAILFAPSRGETFQLFVDLAVSTFSVTTSEVYDERIQSMHHQMKAKGLDHYDENLHFPLYLKLKKTQPSTS
ncbi:calmodulin-lysine N-methyltransferase-like [Gigantopelta aegis]|uniref:calmodulin-lysine N-methyltransferase-like n=1 Tax=Gigantopelta aegis TaxID=1735272 RepID=UPI001B88902F|nr:calmodulin-lysine N-methyltransferase-like [Gigantopelta aegis]